jgi:hypothetical protein
VVSTKKSISLACRPGTHSCAISIAPLKLASPIAGVIRFVDSDKHLRSNVTRVTA